MARNMLPRAGPVGGVSAREAAGRSRPRIAILTNYPVDHATFRTGVETASAALLDGLRAHQDRFEFHVVSLTAAGRTDRREQRAGFAFHFLGVPDRPWIRPRLPYRAFKAYRELRRIDPDLVHCQDNMALALAAGLSAYRRVFTVHGVKRHEASKRTGWEFWSAWADGWIERWVHRRFEAFICISGYAAAVVGDRPRRFAIPNAVSPSFFEPSAVAPVPDRAYLVFVGALAPLKRPRDLLLAHAELRRQFPTLECDLCGDAEDHGYVDDLRRMVEERKIGGVRFLGRVGRAEVVERIRGARALVLPSAQENAPMVIAEAMALGTPVVATRVGGIPDMVQSGETGLLYDAGDVAGLTERLRQLLADPGRRARLGEQARRAAIATYAPSRVAAVTVAAYQELLGRDERTVPEGSRD